MGNIYKYNERNRYVTEANLAVEKKTGTQKVMGVLRPVAQAQVGGEEALNFLIQTGQASVDNQGGMEYIVIKEFEVAWDFTTTHVPFIPTRNPMRVLEFAKALLGKSRFGQTTFKLKSEAIRNTICFRLLAGVMKY